MNVNEEKARIFGAKIFRNITFVNRTLNKLCEEVQYVFFKLNKVRVISIWISDFLCGLLNIWF